MKNVMLTACGLFMAFCATHLYAQAQEGVYVVHLDENTEVFNDTLVIELGGNNQVFFIGDELKKMKTFTRADSVKMLFMNDLDQAIRSGAVKEESQRVFYFIDRTGKRRLKTENPEYNEHTVDVDYEIKRLNLNLGKYEYHIYDLASGYRFDIYLDDAAELKKLLGGISLNEAILYAGTALKKELKRSYKVSLTSENNGFRMKSRTQGHYGSIELVPSFGAGLLGNTPAPVIGLDLWMRLTDKYSQPKYKIGAGFETFPFVSSVGGEVTGVSFVRSYTLKLAMNFGNSKNKPYWFGIQGGFMNSNEIKSYNEAVKAGIIFEGLGRLSYSFDLIRDTHKNSIYGLTVKLPF